MQTAITAADVLAFWFPPGLEVDQDTHSRQFQWWFRGGADQAIVARYRPLLEAAGRGELDDWADQPRSRLALILVLDQFSRTVHRDTAQAFAQDAKALELALDGLDNGHYARLASVWEKTFFVLPLGIRSRSRCLNVAWRCAKRWSARRRSTYARCTFSASQARGHREVVARFGRHPHRNALPGRASTEDERAYLASGEVVHRRSLPG